MRCLYDDILALPDHVVGELIRTLEVLRLEGSRWAIPSVRSNDDVVRAEPFDATELSLKLLWVEDAGSP